MLGIIKIYWLRTQRNSVYILFIFVVVLYIYIYILVVLHTVESQKYGVKTLFVTFEEALTLMHPILFPNWHIPPIKRENNLRESYRLLSIQWFRIDLALFSLILYIFDIIVRDEILLIHIMFNGYLKINSRYPSSHFYWLQKKKKKKKKKTLKYMQR